MPISVNLNKDEAKKRSFDPLPAGWYQMRVSNIELTKSKGEKYAGAAMFKIEFEVTEDSEPKDEDGAAEFGGRRAWRSLLLAEGTFGWGAGDFLRAIGACDIQAGNVEVPTPEEFDYVGQVLMVRMSAQKDEKAQAKLENREPETQPSGYKSADPDDNVSGPAIPASGRRRVLR